MIAGFFKTWVKKGSVIGEELSRTFKYYRVFKNLDDGLGAFLVVIYAYDGEGDTDWGEDELGNLLPNIRRVCTLTADLSGLQRFLKVQKTSEGQDFWKVAFNVNVLFGGTTLKARVTWKEGVSISHFHPHVTDLVVPFRKPCEKALSTLFRTQSTRSRLLSIIRGWEA